MVAIGQFGGDGFGDSPYGSDAPLFSLVSAQSLTANLVELTFSDIIDYSHTPNFDTANYQISLDVEVVAVLPGSGRTLILVTTTLSHVVYTVTVANLQDIAGGDIDPDNDTATFVGSNANLFRAVAVSALRVRLIFDQELLNNSDLADPAQYTVTDLDGNPLVIVSVIVEPSVTAVTLVLEKELTSTTFYNAIVGSGVLTATGLPIIPDQAPFQWVSSPLHAVYKIARFSGEVTGGLFGNPLGLVYFSPALETPEANSIIQVDEVDVCTRSYDVYTFPVAVDPAPLYTFQLGAPASTLNTTVLWGNFPRMVEARIEVSDLQEDTATQPFDGPAVATFREPWDPSRVALLNNTGWMLFDNSAATVPPVFICADNSAPIPPGPTVVVVLQP